MAAGKGQYRWGYGVLFAAFAAAGIVGLAVRWSPEAVSLAAGLECVENADADGVDRIERSLEKSGRSDEAIVLRCAWLTQRGRYSDVLQRLPQRLITGPLRHDVLRIVGECLFRVGNLRQAEGALTQLAAEFPDDVTAHRLLAAMYYDLGSNDLALKALAETQRLAPLDYRPNHLAGMILSDSEEFQEAVKQFRLALDRHPPPQVQTAIRQDLARALMLLREYPQAVDVLENDQRSTGQSALLAECYWSLGNKTRAAELVDRLLQQNVDDAAALRVKARLQDDEGDIEESIATTRKVLAIEPFDVDSRYRLVQMLGLRGLTEERDREQAEYSRYRSLQDRLVALNLKASEEPDAVAPRRELVQVCRELGRDQLAEMWQRAADFCQQRQSPQK